MKDLSEIEFHLSINTTRGICSLLFQSGVQLKVKAGVSINNLLCKQLSLDKTYVDNRISTIFVNGQPVDDIDTAIIKNNDTLALSGSMPGLLGATLRRDSHLAPFRDTITFKGYRDNIVQHYGLIHLKLFNFISQEVGPLLLQRGVMVDLEDVIDLFDDKMSEKINGHLDIYLDGKKAGLNELREILKSGVKQKLIHLKVKIS
jgi:hypothetical protein